VSQNLQPNTSSTQVTLFPRGPAAESERRPRKKRKVQKKYGSRIYSPNNGGYGREGTFFYVTFISWLRKDEYKTIVEGNWAENRGGERKQRREREKDTCRKQN